MKLWLLEARFGYNEKRTHSCWRRAYDGCRDKFVVKAETEEEARQIAHENGGQENYAAPNISPWLDENYTTCTHIKVGKPGLVTFEDLTE